MRSRKLTALLMTTVLCATSLFGCGGSDDATTTAASGNNGGSNTTDPNQEKKTLTLKVWGNEAMTNPEQGDWLKVMCEKFATEHPNWTITWDFGTASEADTVANVTKDPANAADVFFYASDQLKTLVEAGGLVQFGEAATKYVKDTNSATIVDSVTYNGGVYGIPYTTNIWFMYYDKSKFTADDIKSLDAMMAKEKVGFPLKNAWYNQAFFLATGCSFSETKFDFEGAKAEEALQYMIDNFQSGKLVECDGVSLLQDGQVAAAFGGSWNAADAKKYLGDNYGVAAIPKINVTNGDGQLDAMAGSKAVGVNPNADDQYVAVELAKFLTSEAAQAAQYEALGTIPCNTALLAQDKYKTDELAIAQNASFDNCSILQPTYLNNDNWWTPAADLGNGVIGGTVTDVKAKVAEFNAAINAALAK